MPYCPKCDMEFVEGMTVCTDCHGPLVETKEAAMAMKQKEKEEKMKEMAERMAAMEAAANNGQPVPQPLSMTGRRSKTPVPSNVYVKKSQKYADMKSSASAFYVVGAIMIAAALCLWLNILNLPMTGMNGLLIKIIVTAIGIASFAIAFSSAKSAKSLAVQAEAENEKEDHLIQWFLSSYTKETIDKSLEGELDDLSPEEISLKRLELIQDILITNQDISDQLYADSLAEELYTRIFE